ncbi:MAG: glycosyltransferase family 4 protein [Anaerolineae bacterium]
MHVIVNGWFWDRPETGSGQYVQRLTEGLQAIDPEIELTVALPLRQRDGVKETSSNSRLQLLGCLTSRTNLGKLHWEQLLMPRLARQLGADLLHTPYWAAPLTSPVPDVVTVHDIIPLILPAYRGGPLVRLYTALVRATTSRVTMILTDSEASRADILQHLTVPSDRVHVVPLAVGDEYNDQPEKEDGEIRTELRLPRDYVLYLGGFDVRKNLRGALESFAIVRRACPDATLVVAGRLPESDTEFSPDPRRLARESNIPEEAILYLGFVSERQKRTLYREARVFLCPSIYEGFGYTALEAISCGTPVVGSNTTSLPEVVGDAGVLLPPHDVEGIAGALIQLLTDDVFHAELRASARRQAHRFSWARTARETLSIYRDALL